MPGTGPIKLRARDPEDLQTVAACLQDALVPLSDIAYLKAEKRFVMVVNRFRWESGAAPTPEPELDSERESDARYEEAAAGPLYQRVNCGICFDWVRNVKFREFDLRGKSQILNMLTLKAEPGAITLLFSGGAAIRLEVSGIRCHLEDLNEPWPTRWLPSHDEPEPEC